MIMGIFLDLCQKDVPVGQVGMTYTGDVIPAGNAGIYASWTILGVLLDSCQMHEGMTVCMDIKL